MSPPPRTRLHGPVSARAEATRLEFCGDYLANFRPSAQYLKLGGKICRKALFNKMAPKIQSVRTSKFKFQLKFGCNHIIAFGQAEKPSQPG